MNSFSFLAISMLMGLSAQASTVTYLFSQGGFLDGSGNSGTLTGQFTGTAEQGGLLQLTDLTSFSASFHETFNGQPNTFNFSSANDFLYDPNKHGSLSFSSGLLGSIAVCSGADVNTLCGGVGASGFFQDLPVFGNILTSQVATVTAQSSTPEPGTSVMLATGVALLLLGTIRRSMWGGHPRLQATPGSRPSVKESSASIQYQPGCAVSSSD